MRVMKMRVAIWVLYDVAAARIVSRAPTLLFDFVRCGVQIQENVLEYAVIDCCST